MENIKAIYQGLIEEFIAMQVSDTAKKFVRGKIEELDLPAGKYKVSIEGNSLRILKRPEEGDTTKRLYIINTDGGNEVIIRRRIATIKSNGDDYLSVLASSTMEEERYNLFLDTRPIYQKYASETRTGFNGVKEVNIYEIQKLTQRQFTNGALSKISIKQKNVQKTRPIGETFTNLYDRFEEGYCPTFDMEGLNATYDTLTTKSLVNGCYVITSKALYGGNFDNTIGYVKVNNRGQIDPSLETVGVEMDIDQDEATLFGASTSGYRSIHTLDTIDITNNVIRKLEKVNPE